MTERCAHLHLYGKQGARRGRKMGHVLILSDDAPHEVAERVSRALARTAHAPR
jgi:phosphoribosylaminoimidazole carboxylase (NCAIR synthetase)